MFDEHLTHEQVMVSYIIKRNDLTFQIYRTLGNERRLYIFRRKGCKTELLELVHAIPAAATAASNYLIEHIRRGQIHYEFSLPLNEAMGIRGISYSDAYPDRLANAQIKYLTEGNYIRLAVLVHGGYETYGSWIDGPSWFSLDLFLHDSFPPFPCDDTVIETDFTIIILEKRAALVHNIPVLTEKVTEHPKVIIPLN
jgi:hypothetical protein